jgi:mannose-6-phosphate isomerase-like protein (cupin superfamily)
MDHPDREDKICTPPRGTVRKARRSAVSAGSPVTAKFISKTFPRLKFLLFTSFAAALIATGCRAPNSSDRSPVIAPFESVLARPPDKIFPNVRAWDIHHMPFVKLFYVEIQSRIPLRYSIESPTIMLVLSGHMDVRAGLQRTIVGPGSYVYVPARNTYAIRRQGDETLMMAAIYFSMWGLGISQVEADPILIK